MHDGADISQSVSTRLPKRPLVHALTWFVNSRRATNFRTLTSSTLLVILIIPNPTVHWPPDLRHASGTHIVHTPTPFETRHTRSSHAKKAKQVAAAAAGVPLSISGPPSKRWWTGPVARKGWMRCRLAGWGMLKTRQSLFAIAPILHLYPGKGAWRSSSPVLSFP